MCEDPDDSETASLNYFPNSFAGWPEDNSDTNLPDDKRGGSIEAHLHTAQIMASDFPVRPCYIYIVNSLYPWT